MLDYLLPIGSVVTLEEGKHKLMIFGVKQTHSETGKLYDYAGVLYPEGNVGTEYQMLFNHDKIKSIEFRGYENEERERFYFFFSRYVIICCCLNRHHIFLH